MNRKVNYNNKLINSYRQFNNSTTNNPLIQSIKNDHNSKSRNSEQIKQIEKKNEMELRVDKENEKIKQCVIKPIKIINDNRDVNSKMNDVEKNYIPSLKTFWAGRTNEPYKGIIKNNNKEFKKEEDLIVHRVTDADKIGVDDNYKQFKGSIEKHNDELKIIYSTTKLSEHKKKFEYNHKYKYRISHDSKGHEEMKKDKINYYKHEQQKEEENKEKIDNIVETLINQGVFNEDELNDSRILDKKQKYLMRQKNKMSN